jgi:hypothetical protein
MASRSAAAAAGSGVAGPTARISRASVPPWISSDPTATTNATSTSSERLGASSGKVCAAATVTAPRMPAHTLIAPARQSRGSHRKNSMSALRRRNLVRTRSMRAGDARRPRRSRARAAGSSRRSCIATILGRRRSPRAARRRT